MNASPSDASLASSKKPSTANSTSSRRTRTVTVARSISDAVPTAGAAGGAAVATSSGGVRLGSGESRLPTYAALGSADDVSLYEKYLADQRSRPSAAELRHGAGGASSPQHLKASMKRKTISQLIGLDTGATLVAASDAPAGSKSTGALPRTTESVGLPGSSKDNASAGASVDVATRALIALEIESDAKKRREALVVHRTWLATLPIHERLAHQRQQNALRRWRQVNRDWEAFKARTAKRLGKPEQDLVMSRAAAYREHVEMYDALQKARPLADKVGGDIWLVSLRDDGTRFVPVGNIFSGLFCPIRESMRIGPRVRRPFDLSRGQEDNDNDDRDSSNNDDTHGRERWPASQLEKRSSELLATQKRRLRKQLQQLLPHEVGASPSSYLAVDTVDLFEWAARGRGDESARASSDATRNESLALTLSLQHSSSTNSVRAYSQRDLNESGRAQQADALVGPSLTLAVDTTDVVSVPNDGVTNPSLRQPASTSIDSDAPVRLSMYGDTNQQLQRSLVLENDGSTALHYQWTREAFVVAPELTPHLCSHQEDRMTGTGCVTTTSLSATVGTLLPGEKERFAFSFESQRAGVVLDKWRLDVYPPARINAYAGDDRNVSSPSHCGPLHVHLSCTAVDNFVPRQQLVSRQREMERKATVFMVEQLLEDVVRNVHSDPAVEFPELQKAARAFYDLNRVSTAFSDVYYSAALMRTCRELYAAAMRALPSSRATVEQTTAPDAREEATSTTDDSGEAPLSTLVSPDAGSVALEDSDKETGLEVPTLATREAEWDSRLASLCAITRQADEWNARQIKQLTAQLVTLSDVEEEGDEEEEQEDGEDDENDEDDGRSEGSGDEDDDDASDTDATTDALHRSKQSAADQGNPETETLADRRERIRQERGEQRRQLEERIVALRPRLQDAFWTAYLEACTAPYARTQLCARLAHGISNLCSEVPVIHAIARMQQARGRDVNGAVRQDTEEGVARVLTRAIDEAVAADADYQRAYEHKRRQFHRVLLSDKLTLEQLLREPGTQATSLELGASQPSSWLANGVVFVLVDLDLANWFTLVRDRADTSTTVASDSDTEGGLELKWQFATELLERDDVVPEKVAQVAHSLHMIQRAVSDSAARVTAMVLVSDLSSPPLTRSTRRLLKRTLQQAPGVDTVDTGSSDDTAKALEERQDRLLTTLESHLSLRPIVTLVKRALDVDADSDATVDFCKSLTQLDEKLHALRRTDAHNADAKSTLDADAVVGADLPVPAPTLPAIIVLEHIKVLARAASGDSASKDTDSEDTAPPPVNAPAPVGVPSAPAAEPKPGAATTLSRKKSVPPPALQPKTTAPADPKATAATVSSPPSLVLPSTATTTTAMLEASAPTTAASDRTSAVVIDRTHADALGLKFAERCDVFVLDTLLPSPWDRVLPRQASATVGQAEPPVVLGPHMRARAEQWDALTRRRTLLSPGLSPVVSTTAIVGGTNLARKLRLIDSLLEVVDAIYFVGDVALSLYRVLFTTHDDRRRRWRKEPERSPLSLWSVLGPAVERLKQKAQRKCVELLLPVDWIVGESSLEEQDTTSGGVMDDDDELDDDDEEENDRDDAGERGSKKKSKRPKKRGKAAAKPKKPVVEPDEVTPWRAGVQWAYEGAIARVGYRTSPGLAVQVESTSWVSVFDVGHDVFTKFVVVEGKESVLTSRPSTKDDNDDDGDDSEDETVATVSSGSIGDPHDGGFEPLESVAATTGVGSPGDGHTSATDTDDVPADSELDNPTDFEFEWTFRAFDVGSESMELLLRRLDDLDRSAESSGNSGANHPHHQLIVHGLFGAVEFQGFDRATREFVAFLERRQQVTTLQSVQNEENESRPRCCVVVLSGEATLQWIQRFEAAVTTPPNCKKLVTNEDRKMAFMVRDVLAAKPNSVMLRLRDGALGVI